MFGKKRDTETFNTINLIVGMARTLELNPVKLVKNAIDFDKNTQFINKMNDQIVKESSKCCSKKK